MSQNDLPLHEKLAALIVAGRTANPQISHCRYSLGGRNEHTYEACAIGYAMLGAGVDRTQSHPYQGLIEALDPRLELRDELFNLISAVESLNDRQIGGGGFRYSLDEVIEMTRSGKAYEVPA